MSVYYVELCNHGTARVGGHDKFSLAKRVGREAVN